MKTRFIVNPRSGRGARVLERVRTFAADIAADIALTTHPRHAADLARAALTAGCELIVAVGGDGTLNEVAGQLVHTDATLGLVPCGSGNGLGRNLGIHGSLERALHVLRFGAPRLIDSGLADGHPFFTVAGLGFEAEIAARFNELKKRGFLRYLRTGTVGFLGRQPSHCTIEHAGGRAEISAFTLAVANSDQYGNNAHIAPGARVDDGLLDLTVVSSLTFFNTLPLMARLFTKTLRDGHHVLRLRGTHFTVERLAPGLVHTDGETHLAGRRVEFSVRPNSLRLLCPAGFPPR